MHDALTVARHAALAGGATIRQRTAAPGGIRTKRALTDLVTDTDIAAGIAIVEEILRHVPDARFVIEETEVYELAGATEGRIDEGHVWVVDPLDGTTSFVHGFPCYSVSVALLHDGRPEAGAVYNVPADELFSAAAGHGATRDADHLRCTETAELDEALLVTGFPYDRTKLLDRQLGCLAAFLRAPVHGVRRDGSAAIDCCHIAAGRADGFWEFGLQPWDTAAGALIAREAGARVTDIEGKAWSVRGNGILVANPDLHAKMLDVVSSVPGPLSEPRSDQ